MHSVSMSVSASVYVCAEEAQNDHMLAKNAVSSLFISTYIVYVLHIVKV